MRCSISIFLIATALATEGEDCEPAVDSDLDGWTVCATDQDPFSGVCDCDDSNAVIYPGAKETNSKYDDDCDGAPEWTRYEDIGDFYYFYLRSPFIGADNLVVAVAESDGFFSYSEYGSLVNRWNVYTDYGTQCTTVVATSHDQLSYSSCGAVLAPDGNVDICVASLNQQMNQASSWTWRGNVAQYSRKALQMADGGLLLGGLITDNLGNHYDGPLVLKLVDDQLSWSRVGDAPFRLSVEAIAEARSGDVFVAGCKTLTSDGDYRPWAERLSPGGVLEREWVDWPELPIIPYGMLTPWDGDVVLYGTDEDGCFAVGRFTEDLDPIWLWQSPDWDCLGVAVAGVETSTGDLAIAGSTGSYFGGWCGLFYLINPSGELSAKSTPCGRNRYTGITQMPDGGFVLTGETNYHYGFIMRTDKYLNMPPQNVPQ